MSKKKKHLNPDWVRSVLKSKKGDNMGGRNSENYRYRGNSNFNDRFNNNNRISQNVHGEKSLSNEDGVFKSDLTITEKPNILIPQKLLEDCNAIQKIFPGLEFSILVKGKWTDQGFVVGNEFVIPDQEVDGARVYFNDKETYDYKLQGYNTIIHSHPFSSSSFSGSDLNTISIHYDCSILYSQKSFTAATLSWQPGEDICQKIRIDATPMLLVESGTDVMLAWRPKIFIAKEIDDKCNGLYKERVDAEVLAQSQWSSRGFEIRGETIDQKRDYVAGQPNAFKKFEYQDIVDNIKEGYHTAIRFVTKSADTKSPDQISDTSHNIITGLGCSCGIAYDGISYEGTVLIRMSSGPMYLISADVEVDSSKPRIPLNIKQLIRPKTYYNNYYNSNAYDQKDFGVY